MSYNIGKRWSAGWKRGRAIEINQAYDEYSRRPEAVANRHVVVHFPEGRNPF